MSNEKENNKSTLPPEQQPQGVHIGDLRKMLFETITGIKNGTVRVEQAKTISDLSQVIINSAKVEVDFIKATGGKAKGSGFLDKPADVLVIEHEEDNKDGKSGTALSNGLVAEQKGEGSTVYRASDREPGK